MTPHTVESLEREVKSLTLHHHPEDRPDLYFAIIDKLLAALKEARLDQERLEDAMHQISQWSKAYPLAVFPEPDFEKAAKLLEAGGITLDAVSASNMRHVITQVKEIADTAMKQEQP